MAPTRKRKSPTTGNGDDSDIVLPSKKATRMAAGASGKGGISVGRAHQTSVTEAKRRIREQADAALKMMKGDGNAGQADVAAALSEVTSPREDDTYEKARECLIVLRRMIGQYEASNKGSSSIARPGTVRWEQDGKDLVELDQRAMAMSVRTLNGSILESTSGRNLTAPGRGASDLEKMAWELLAEGRPGEGEETWGMAAQGMMQAFSGVVKLLREA